MSVIFGCILASVAAGSSTVYPEASTAVDAAQSILSFDKARAYGSGFVRNGAVIECDNGSDVKAMRGAQWRVDLDQKTAVPFSVTAEGLTTGLTGKESCNCSVYLDIVHQDGTKTYGKHAAFSVTENKKWQSRTVTVAPESQ